eukprot:3168629-Pyramimonas_sp.AAC.1
MAGTDVKAIASKLLPNMALGSPGSASIRDRLEVRTSKTPYQGCVTRPTASTMGTSSRTDMAVVLFSSLNLFVENDFKIRSLI